MDEDTPKRSEWEEMIEAALEDLHTRLTHLEAFGIASYVTLKEDLLARGVSEKDFGRMFLV